MSFVTKGFPYKNQMKEYIYCNGLLYVFPTRNIVNFLNNFTFFTATYFSKAQYSQFVLEVPLTPINQSTGETEFVCINYWLPSFSSENIRKLILA